MDSAFAHMIDYLVDAVTVLYYTQLMIYTTGNLRSAYGCSRSVIPLPNTKYDLTYQGSAIINFRRYPTVWRQEHQRFVAPKRQYFLSLCAALSSYTYIRERGITLADLLIDSFCP